MERAVLDASALLALILDEPGGNFVRGLIQDAAVSAINWSETSQRLLEQDRDPVESREDLTAGGLGIKRFGVLDAEAAAKLREPTRALGLSLADRACLALAQRLGVPAYTADRRWSDLDVGVEIILIR